MVVPALRWFAVLTLALGAPAACSTKAFTSDDDASAGKPAAGSDGEGRAGSSAASGGASEQAGRAGSAGGGGTAGTATSSGGRGGRRSEGGRSAVGGRGGSESASGHGPTETSTGGDAEMGGAAGEGGAGNTGATGGSAGAGTGGASGTGTGGATGVVGHRYARLVALTSIPNDNLTSVAEFEILDADGHSLPRSGWTPMVDSEELVDSYSPGSQAIDGDSSTVWQTEWGDYVAPLPHTLTIDMGQAELVSGFVYTPRQDWYSGRIGAWEFYLSNDPNDFGSPVTTGNFPDSYAVTTKTFTVQ